MTTLTPDDLARLHEVATKWSEVDLPTETLRALLDALAEAQQRINALRVENEDNRKIVADARMMRKRAEADRDAAQQRAEKAGARIREIESVLLGRLENAQRYFAEHGSYSNPKPLPYDMQGE